MRPRLRAAVNERGLTRSDPARGADARLKGIDAWHYGNVEKIGPGFPARLCIAPQCGPAGPPEYRRRNKTPPRRVKRETGRGILWMRKQCLICCLLLLCLLASACAAPADVPEPDAPAAAAVYQGKVAAVRETEAGRSLLLCGDGDTALYWLALDGLSLYDADGAAADTSFQPGDTVEVGYDGMTAESWPGSFGSPAYARRLSAGDDLVGLYLQIIDRLYQTDPGLNSDISLLAFDLSAVENLSPAEQAALLYLAGDAYGVETRQATFDKLADSGLIDRERLVFPDGLLISFSDMEFSSDSFRFAVQKWRSGLGAYFFIDCEAVKKNGVWSFTIGVEAIS